MNIDFIGTAGGRVSTFKKLRRSGGFLIREKESITHIDPGPGAFVYLSDFNLNPWDLDIIILSHLHLDHSSDINSILESCYVAKKNVYVFAPKDALTGSTKVIYDFLLNKIKDIYELRENESYNVKDFNIKVLTLHPHHGALTYGILVNDKLAYHPCSKYSFDAIVKYPKNLKALILNTTFYKKRQNIDHLSAEEVVDIISYLRPELAIITHFSTEMIEKNPDLVARELEEKTGIKTVAAFDGMSISL